MLKDYRNDSERRAARFRPQRRITISYSQFLAGLATWSWFVTLTFRDSALVIRRQDSFEPIAPWGAQSRLIQDITYAQRDLALAKVTDFLTELQRAARTPVGWVLVEGRGDFGRMHLHGLVCAVSHLNRDAWEAEAERRFGSARFFRYDPSRPAARYISQHVEREDAGLFFGGVLRGTDLSRSELASRPTLHGSEIANSVELPAAFFHATLQRRHR